MRQALVVPKNYKRPLRYLSSRSSMRTAAPSTSMRLFGKSSYKPGTPLIRNIQQEDQEDNLILE